MSEPSKFDDSEDGGSDDQELDLADNEFNKAAKQMKEAKNTAEFAKYYKQQALALLIVSSGCTLL